MIFGIAVPPRVQSMQPQTTLVGSTTEFRCYATGQPLPMITWYKDGRKIATGDRFIVTSSGLLQIYWTELSDAGVYNCTATSAAGTDSEAVVLSVLGKSQWRRQVKLGD